MVLIIISVVLIGRQHHTRPILRGSVVFCTARAQSNLHRGGGEWNPVAGHLPPPARRSVQTIWWLPFFEVKPFGRSPPGGV